MKKFLFYLIWLTIILIGPFTVFSTTPIELVVKDQGLLINFLQRVLGLMAFSLIFSQVILGSYMRVLTQRLGAWIYKFHTTEGIFTYLFILAHPFLFVLLNYRIRGTLDPFYVYTDICILCKPMVEYFYTFGRVAFWFLTIAVIAAKFRTHPWLRVHWLKFHVLNFLSFYLISLHAWFVGSDLKTSPFIYFFWIAQASVSISLLYKIIHPIFARAKATPNQASLKLQK